MFYLNKELHLSHQHYPHANETDEHYCRRWISLEVLKKICDSKKNHIFDLQISNYPEDNVKYLILSSATKDPFKKNCFRSISIGLLINKQLRSKLKFLDDPAIQLQDVGVTCEQCAILNCKQRKGPSIILDKAKRHSKIENVVEELFNKFN